MTPTFHEWSARFTVQVVFPYIFSRRLTRVTHPMLASARLQGRLREQTEADQQNASLTATLVRGKKETSEEPTPLN